MAIEDFSSLDTILKTLTTNLQTPKMIFIGFKNEKVSKNELFLHSYEPMYESAVRFFNQSIENPVFSILKKEIIENDGEIMYEFQSVEDYDVVASSDPGSDPNFRYYDLDEYTITTKGLNYSQQEIEGVVYNKPIEIQINLNEETTIAQTNYINSIPRKEIQFDILSSLGVIATEGAITESITTGTSTEITSTTEVITDVGGPTATGTRTNIIEREGTDTRDVIIRSY